jgi:hypothetical protein
LHGGGDFSHAHVIMHKYFGKKLEMQKLNIWAFEYSLTCFLAWNVFAHIVDTWGQNFKPSEYKKPTK